MYLIILFIIVLFNLNKKEGYLNRSFLEKIRRIREQLLIQEEQRLQNIRNIFLQHEQERIKQQQKRLENTRRLEAERLERERIQAILDEQRRLRWNEEQKEHDLISKEENQGILTSYLSY